MKLNQERLRDEIEIEIAYEEGKKRELENRHAAFIKSTDFLVATRIVNLKMNLDKPEAPMFPGQSEKSCKMCKIREEEELLMQNSSGHHVYAQVRKSNQGSPTRFKGKRETIPTLQNIT